MKRLIAFLMLGIFLFANCAGREPNLVKVHQFGDEEKSCMTLEREIIFIEEEIRRLVPKTDKTGKNVALGVTGAFFMVPLFFMDFSKAEKMEINALRERYNYLTTLAAEKGCKRSSSDEKKPKDLGDSNLPVEQKDSQP